MSIEIESHEGMKNILQRVYDLKFNSNEESLRFILNSVNTLKIPGQHMKATLLNGLLNRRRTYELVRCKDTKSWIWESGPTTDEYKCFTCDDWIIEPELVTIENTLHMCYACVEINFENGVYLAKDPNMKIQFPKRKKSHEVQNLLE